MSMPMYFPAPTVPEEQQATAPVSLRFEDVTQDGRVLLGALFHGLSEAIWRPLLHRHPMTAVFLQQGIVPVLTLLVLEGTSGPFAVDPPLTAHGCYQLARGPAPDGTSDRLYLNMWVELTGLVGQTYAPPSRVHRTPLLAGRVFAEHTFTRPFAPPGERRVTRFEIPGMPEVPEASYVPLPLSGLLELPSGAVPLEETFTADVAPVVFGIGHTDSNRHVNALVYPRLFEQAALRRFAALGHAPTVLPRKLAIAFRKPCFAGQSVRIVLKAFLHGDHLGAVGAFVDEFVGTSPDALTTTKPYCSLRMWFER